MAMKSSSSLVLETPPDPKRSRIEIKRSSPSLEFVAPDPAYWYQEYWMRHLPREGVEEAIRRVHKYGIDGDDGTDFLRMGVHRRQHRETSVRKVGPK